MTPNPYESPSIRASEEDRNQLWDWAVAGAQLAWGFVVLYVIAGVGVLGWFVIGWVIATDFVIQAICGDPKRRLYHSCEATIHYGMAVMHLVFMCYAVRDILQDLGY